MSAVWRDSLADLRGSARTSSWSDLRPILEALVRASIDVSSRVSMTREDTALLNDLLSNGNMADAQVADTVLFVVKLMRNLCAGVPQNQRHFLQIGSLENIVRLIKQLVLDQSLCSKWNLLLTAALQFLGNMCTGCLEAQGEVWTMCFPTVFASVVNCGVGEPADTCCMVIHVCTLGNMERRMQLCSQVTGCHDIIATPSVGCDIIAAMLHSLASTSHSEWTIILLEALTQSTPLPQLYSCLEHHPTALVVLLSFICTRLTSVGAVGALCTVEWVEHVLSEGNIMFVCTHYKRIASDLLSAEGGGGGGGEKINLLCATVGLEQDLSRCEEFSMFKSTLGLLCHFSSFEECLVKLQMDPTMLETTLALLRWLSTLDGSVRSGKHRTKLSAASPTGEESKHPLFGLKSGLVRLVANLCYKCPDAQTKVNVTGSIPLILNQCSIDCHNPYIMQWAVFAVRNLCEDNPANQAFITSLEQQGLTDAAKLLEFGCEVVVGSDGKISRLRDKSDDKHV